jgi:hemerythrin
MTRRLIENRRFLQETWLFGDHIGYPLERSVAVALTPVQIGPGEAIAAGAEPSLSLVADGELVLTRNGQEYERIPRYSFFGEDEVLYGTRVFGARAVTPATLLIVPARVVADIPIVQWKLLQTNEKRQRLTARAPVLAGA